jgi:4-diphosphocytidyl-2-C-methyl-D-erythritol kinase
MSRVLVLRPPAKINLTLHVGPLRADGYHDVRTLMQTVALCDTLTVTARPGPFALATRSPGVPSDRTNLVWRAAEALWRAMGRDGEPRDAHVRLAKQIPPAAGLAGGSADAAAALVALNEIWDARKSRHELVRLAAELGADVPFFLFGGTALGTVRGDELFPVDDVKRFGVVIIKPSFGVATADAYRWLDADRVAGNSQSTGHQALEVGWPTGPVTIQNDLQAPVARRHAGIDEQVAALRREGALATAMSGSGSAVFGLFPEAGAPHAGRRLQRQDWLICVTRTLNRRESARKMGL